MKNSLSMFLSFLPAFPIGTAGEPVSRDRPGLQERPPGIVLDLRLGGGRSPGD